VAEPARIYRVSELNRKVALKLERWGQVWVEGEICDLRRSAQGHVYLTLRDERESAQLRCVMFSSDVRRARAELREDARIRVRGAFDLYQPRGSLSLVIRVALPAGEGTRREQIERLKKKLHGEGLFAVERKRPLPRFPRTVGVVTSRRGAALHDIIRVASSRAPVRLVLSHCVVQGDDAPASVVMALRRIAKLDGLDVVIVARGGGASEDLSAFDDERVARAIAACPVPVVTGVGHEVDGSIADLVADVRAATPSQAAELVVPEREVLRDAIANLERRLQREMDNRIGADRMALERLARRLPASLAGVRRQFERSRIGLERAVRRGLAEDRRRVRELDRRLHRMDPSVRLQHQRQTLEALTARMVRAMPPALAAPRRALDRVDARLAAAPGPALRHARATLGALAGRLDALSPLRVLARGYAIALADGKALTDAAQITAGDPITVRLAKGRLQAEVRAVEESE